MNENRINTKYQAIPTSSVSSDDDENDDMFIKIHISDIKIPLFGFINGYGFLSSLLMIEDVPDRLWLLYLNLIISAMLFSPLGRSEIREGRSFEPILWGIVVSLFVLLVSNASRYPEMLDLDLTILPFVVVLAILIPPILKFFTWKFELLRLGRRGTRSTEIRHNESENYDFARWFFSVTLLVVLVGLFPPAEFKLPYLGLIVILLVYSPLERRETRTDHGYYIPLISIIASILLGSVIWLTSKENYSMLSTLVLLELILPPLVKRVILKHELIVLEQYETKLRANEVHHNKPNKREPKRKEQQQQ